MSGTEKLWPASDDTANWYAGAMEHLVEVVQDLSQARDLESVMAIVRDAARNLTGADGSSFILRDGDFCYYGDENAISPLWKGQRFPMKNCVSGWVMLNKQSAVIPDIYVDPRVPVDAYRPTFVKSMAMVPIRAANPIGAIGNYWSKNRHPTTEEVKILQALADITSVTLENVDLYRQLNEKLRALENSNEELSRFAWIASHDLKSPLRGIDNIASWIEEDLQQGLQTDSIEHLRLLRQRARRMEKLLDDILDFAYVGYKLSFTKSEMVAGDVLVQDAVALLDIPSGFKLQISDSFKSLTLPRMPLQRVFTNLVDNAIKHHDRSTGVISINAEEPGEQYSFTVQDDGPGIPAKFQDRIFEMFQTLKPRDITEGSGMGLAIVKKILASCGAAITVESKDRGTLFRFTWPKILEAVSHAEH